MVRALLTVLPVWVVASAVILFQAYQRGDVDPKATAYRRVCEDFSGPSEVKIPTCGHYLTFYAATDEDRANAHRALGNAHTGQDPVSAIANFREAVRLEPANANAYFYLGLAQTRSGACVEGAASLERAVALDSRRGLWSMVFSRPEEVSAYHAQALGEAYQCLGDWPRARSSYEQAVDLRRKVVTRDNLWGYRSQLAQSLDGRAKASDALGQTEAADRDRKEAELLRIKR